MNEFIEFLKICFITANVPFTVMLGAVFIYWIMFIIGAVGLDTFDLDMDMDLDADVDVDLDLDMNVDASADVDMDAEMDVDGELAGTGGGTAGGSLWVSVLRFFNVGDVPLMVLVSVLVFSSWAMGVLGNYYLNPRLTTGRSALLLAPVLFLSLLVTKVVTMPIRKLFSHANAGVEAPTQMVGKTCIVTTSEVTSTFGQARLVREGPPITLNVRCAESHSLSKGDEAVITEHLEKTNTYMVIPFNWEVKS
jgi:hypothetical protein